MCSFLVWCGLLLWIGAFCVRGNWFEPSSVPPVAACWSIKPVCTRPWPSVRPVRPPRALTVNKSWVWPVFDACVGVCRVSGVHGLNVPSPLCPPHAHSYHGVYLQSMDPPPPPSSAGLPDDHDDRVSGTHRLNSPAPLPPTSRVPSTPGSFFLCSFHLGATTTTTTTTIITTPRRQATAGKCFIFFTQGNRLGRDVKLSFDKSVPLRSFSTQRDVLRDGDLVLQRIRHLVSLRLALLNLGRLPVGCDTWLQGGVHVAPFLLFPLRVGFLVGTCFRSCLCFFGIFFILAGFFS